MNENGNLFHDIHGNLNHINSLYSDINNSEINPYFNIECLRI